MRLTLGTLILLVSVAPGAMAQRKNPEGVAVLLLSGGQREHHGYREQANALARALEETGRYRVTIVEDAAVLETPALVRYRAVIVLADRRDPEFRLHASQQRALLDYVRDRANGGLVSLHAADNAAPDWDPAMRVMLGGVFSHDTSGGRPDGKVRKGRYRVRITGTRHPITAGLADFELDDELYYHMQMEPGVEPLATVSYDGTDWPVAWTRTYGHGRVFHTPLGHRDFGPDKHDPLEDANLLRLVIQGLDWVVAERAPESTQEPSGGGE
jgi:type 1 glutamine amidotransferase